MARLEYDRTAMDKGQFSTMLCFTIHPANEFKGVFSLSSENDPINHNAVIWRWSDGDGPMLHTEPDSHPTNDIYPINSTIAFR